MQRRYAGIMIIVLLVVFSGMSMAANVPVQQDPRDQAFINALAQPASPQACSRVGANIEAAVPRVNCTTSFCNKIGQCSTCPGGLSAWYCNLDAQRCTPF
jgi:hypothetical protein